MGVQSTAFEDQRRFANVLGVAVDAIDMQTAVATILRAVRSGRRGYVCVTGVHGIMEAQRDPELRRILNSSLLTTPDGMPTVWIGRWQGHTHMRRVYGPDLMLELCAATAREPVRHFLYGGNTGVAEELATELTRRFPGVQVVGCYTPPFRDLTQAELDGLRAQMSTARPDIVWVGLSTPKQERFMARYLSELPVTVMIGVGAAFDMHTGRTRQAPRWMQVAGLEWAFRLATEPRRLWRRYLSNNPRFVLAILRQFLAPDRHDIERSHRH